MAKNADTGQHPCNTQIYGLCCITGNTCIEAKPVENFSSSEAIPSMQASTTSDI